MTTSIVPSEHRKILGVEIDFDAPIVPGFNAMESVQRLRTALEDLKEAEALHLEAKDAVDRLVEEVANGGALIKWSKDAPAPVGNITERLKAWIEKEGPKKSFTARQAIAGADLPYNNSTLSTFHQVRRGFTLHESKETGNVLIFRFP